MRKWLRNEDILRDTDSSLAVRRRANELTERLVQDLGLDENRESAVERRHGTGKRTARENVADLTDGDSFVEWGPLVEPGEYVMLAKSEFAESCTEVDVDFFYGSGVSFSSTKADAALLLCQPPAGMPMPVRALTSGLIRTRPSTREYSVCRRR